MSGIPLFCFDGRVSPMIDFRDSDSLWRDNVELWREHSWRQVKAGCQEMPKVKPAIETRSEEVFKRFEPSAIEQAIRELTFEAVTDAYERRGLVQPSRGFERMTASEVQQRRIQMRIAQERHVRRLRLLSERHLHESGQVYLAAYRAEMNRLLQQTRPLEAMTIRGLRADPIQFDELAARMSASPGEMLSRSESYIQAAARLREGISAPRPQPIADPQSPASSGSPLVAPASTSA